MAQDQAIMEWPSRDITQGEAENVQAQY